MSQKTYAAVTGVIFLLIAIGHALRLIFRWHLVLADWTPPVWGSGIAVAIAGFLAFKGLRLCRRV